MIVALGARRYVGAPEQATMVESKFCSFTDVGPVLPVGPELPVAPVVPVGPVGPTTLGPMNDPSTERFWQETLPEPSTVMEVPV